MFLAHGYSDAAIPREWYCKIPQTHNIRGFDRAIRWRMKSINSLYRVATLPMTDTQIDSIENKLLDLGIEGHEEAAQRYTSLYLARLNWEGTRSTGNRQDFVDQAQDAQAWLEENSL